MKVVSSVPSVLSRARKSHWVVLVAPLGWSVTNWPPRMICWFGRIAIAITLPLASGSNPESREPSALRRATQLRVVAVAAPLGCSVENPPPTTIWPFAWTASESTVRFAFGSKPVSSEPSALNRAMWLRVVAAAAPPGCTEENSPPMMIWPLACTAIAYTAPFGWGLKVVSRLPSAFSRAA